MRINRRPGSGRFIAAFGLLCALALACNSEGPGPGEVDLLCGFDGDASPGYQQVGLAAEARNSAGNIVTSAPSGSSVTVEAWVGAVLSERYLCNTDIAVEVLAGGGAVSSSIINTGPAADASPFSYIASLQWTLGAPGVQTLHLWLPDDTSIETMISVTATAVGGMNAILFYNSTDVSANLLGPGESPSPGNLVASHASRQVTIPSAVGSQSQFRAFKGGSLVASLTCEILSTAWEGGSQPLVVYNDNDGNYLTCDEGLGAT